MKFLNIVTLSTILITINKTSACVTGCWSETVGYPCCNEPTDVVFKDEFGEWGIVDNVRCYIMPIVNSYVDGPVPQCGGPINLEFEDCPNSDCSNYRYVENNGTVWGFDMEKEQRCTMNIKDSECKANLKKTCWSVLLGYKCCDNPNESLYKDNDGIWSIENNEWCGVQLCPANTPVDSTDSYGIKWGFDVDNNRKCIVDKSTDTENCRSAPLGYDCCKNPNTKIVTKDSFGYWGIENGKWCGFNETYPCVYYEEYGYKCCENPSEITKSEISNGVFISGDKVLPGYFYRNKETGIYCGLNETPEK